MEKKTTVRFLWVTFLILTTSVIGSTAQEKTITVPEKSAIPIPAPENPNMERFFGTIEKVNELRKTIDVKGKVKKEKKTLTFSINDRTKIARAKKELSMTNLKNGMDVLVEYKKEGDTLIAAVIKVSAPK